MKRLSASIAIGALLATQTGAARPECIPHHDMRVLIRVALPDAIEAVVDRCRPVLPADAFLPNEGAGLANRFRHEAPVDPVAALAAIQDATGQDLSGFASDDTVIGLARQFVSGQIEHHVPLKDCDTIDGIMGLAGNLRADAVAEAILLALELAGPDQVKGLAICPPKDEGAKR